MNKMILVVKIEHRVFENFLKNHTMFIYWQTLITHNETEFVILYSDYPEDNENILKEHFKNIRTYIIKHPANNEKILEACSLIIN